MTHVTKLRYFPFVFEKRLHGQDFRPLKPGAGLAIPNGRNWSHVCYSIIKIRNVGRIFFSFYSGYGQLSSFNRPTSFNFRQEESQKNENAVVSSEGTWHELKLKVWRTFWAYTSFGARYFIYKWRTFFFHFFKFWTSWNNSWSPFGPTPAWAGHPPTGSASSPRRGRATAASWPPTRRSRPSERAETGWPGSVKLSLPIGPEMVIMIAIKLKHY